MLIECLATGLVYSNPKPYLRSRHAFHPADCGPTGLYGFVAPRLIGPYEPLNDSGLVLRNPPD